MKEKIIYTITVSLFLFLGFSEAKAQNHNKEYYKERKEYNKKRAEYYRERDKKREEYYRKRDKKSAEYWREHDKKKREYDKEGAKRRKEYWKDRSRHRSPVWARAHKYNARHHVYFKDYHTFYDPYRGGYVYRQGPRWLFSVAVPSFLVNIDLGRARIRVLGDIPIERRPEDIYGDYDEDYWDD